MRLLEESTAIGIAFAVGATDVAAGIAGCVVDQQNFEYLVEILLQQALQACLDEGFHVEYGNDDRYGNGDTVRRGRSHGWFKVLAADLKPGSGKDDFSSP